jgi:hypothetical protein
VLFFPFQQESLYNKGEAAGPSRLFFYMPNQNIHIVLLLFAATGIAACVTEVEPAADIPAVGYRRDIAPIISANCGVPACHDGSGEEASLLGYDNLIRNGGVKAGDARGSTLYEVIRLYAGEKAMPPTPYQALTDEQIGRIYVWILQDAKNN